MLVVKIIRNYLEFATWNNIKLSIHYITACIGVFSNFDKNKYPCLEALFTTNLYHAAAVVTAYFQLLKNMHWRYYNG